LPMLCARTAATASTQRNTVDLNRIISVHCAPDDIGRPVRSQPLRSAGPLSIAARCRPGRMRASEHRSNLSRVHAGCALRQSTARQCGIVLAQGRCWYAPRSRRRPPLSPSVGALVCFQICDRSVAGSRISRPLRRADTLRAGTKSITGSRERVEKTDYCPPQLLRDSVQKIPRSRIFQGSDPGSADHTSLVCQEDRWCRDHAEPGKVAKLDLIRPYK
jgi:hypothetical protein